jgi:hypothetical protein
MVTAVTPDRPAHADRRRADRYRPAFATVCRFGRAGGVGLVCDLSRTGVRMLLAAVPEVGAVVGGELAPEDGGPAVPVDVRVVRVVPSGTGDYVLGGEFQSPLGEDELRAFVTPPVRTGRPGVAPAAAPG